MYQSNNYTNFNEWFHLILNENESVLPFCKIPNQYFGEYISNIHSISHEEVLLLLRCLLKPFTTGLDVLKYESFQKFNSSNVVKMEKNESIYRLENDQDAWEGVTWILSFLPHKPYRAIKALEYYLISESDIPDDRILV